MNNLERIEKIKEGNSKLILEVTEEKKKNLEAFQISVEKVIQDLLENNNNPKKEAYYLKVKDLLLSLSNEINNAKDIETIIELRKKINYYITKVRKEIEDRKIISFALLTFKKNANEYRKSIAKNIRYLKRIDNINEIERLNSNYDNLRQEELLELKKLIKREQDYNRRNITPEKEILIKFEKASCTPKIIEPDYHKDINEGISKLRQYYSLKELPVYDRSVGGNIFTLVKNIPTYMKNKRIIRSINPNNDLVDPSILNGFVEFNKKRNSIRLTLREIINPRYRDSIESLYLRNDHYCSYWIKNCYNAGLTKKIAM